MRGQMPDTSRGFSPSGAKYYINQLQDIGNSLRKVKAQRDEALQHVERLQHENDVLKSILFPGKV